MKIRDRGKSHPFPWGVYSSVCPRRLAARFAIAFLGEPSCRLVDLFRGRTHAARTELVVRVHHEPLGSLLSGGFSFLGHTQVF